MSTRSHVLPTHSTVSTVSALSAVSAVVVPLVLAAGLAPADAAERGAGVRSGGACSGGAHWRLKAAHDSGRIEVEAEVDSQRSGQVWHWTLRHDGSRSASGRATTGGASDSFEVRRRMADLAGTDRIVFRATHGQQVCRGSVAL